MVLHRMYFVVTQFMFVHVMNNKVIYYPTTVTSEHLYFICTDEWTDRLTFTQKDSCLVISVFEK